MELLAPARDMDALTAAFDAGADAVYLGLKDFSARRRATNFTVGELFRACAHKRAIGKRIYVTVNTLVYEREIPALLEALAAIEAAGADAVIVQDYGVARIVRELGLNLPLHASTQMGTKNHLQASFLQEAGFSRIILERQLTLGEIASIRRRTTVELEVFIHGAMCFSLSGFCFFSKALTGRSGNRGECAQPCRWMFSDEHGRDRLPFSMKDLEGVALLPELRRIGVDGLKIEGRMKGVDYVYPVVRAYRRAIDALERERLDRKDIEDLQREIRVSTLSRKAGGGTYVLAGSPDRLIDEEGADTGVILGRAAAVLRRSLFFRTRESLRVGDSLRVHDKKDDRRFKIPVKAIYAGGRKVREAEAGMYVGVPSPHSRVSAGSAVYLVGRRQPRRAAAAKLRAPAASSDDHGEERARALQGRYLERFASPAAEGSGPVVHRVSFDPEKEIMDAGGEKFLFIPPDLYESRADAVGEMAKRGVDGFFISHPCEARLLPGRKVAGSFYLYAANLAAVDFLRSLGLWGLSLGLDLDEETAGTLLPSFPVWFRWDNVPLWITRVLRKPHLYTLKTRKGVRVAARHRWGLR